MGGILTFLISNPVGKAALNYLLNKLFKIASKEMKRTISDKYFESELKTQLAAYEEIILWADKAAKDGLTEEEKNEIRRRKIEIEKSIISNAANSAAK